MYSLVFYSHTDYSDVWKILFQQTDKYFPNVKKYLFLNKIINDLPKSWNFVEYDEKLPYQKRVSECLKKIDDEIIIFHHEDMILYDQPNLEELEYICKIIKNSDADVVKLIRAEYQQQQKEDFKYKNLFKNPDNLYFAIQPSLCKKEKLLKIYECTGGNNIWQFELNSSMVAKHYKIKSYMYYNGSEKKAGLFHWESKVYPYTATAIVKGKWNFKEYGFFLEDSLLSNNIDKTIRGFV